MLGTWPFRPSKRRTKHGAIPVRPTQRHNLDRDLTNDIEQCLNAFDRHLANERGCAAGTRVNYLREARSFLVFAFPDLRTNWEELKSRPSCWFCVASRREIFPIEPARSGHSDPKFIALPHFRRKHPGGFGGCGPPASGIQTCLYPTPSLTRTTRLRAGFCVRPTMLWINATGPCCFCWPGWVCVRERCSVFSLDHLDWTASAVLIQSSKTARERVLPMPEDVGGALADILGHRKLLSRAVLLD